jgi:hypothetical protein
MSDTQNKKVIDEVDMKAQDGNDTVVCGVLLCTTGTNNNVVQPIGTDSLIELSGLHRMFGEYLGAQWRRVLGGNLSQEAASHD